MDKESTCNAGVKNSRTRLKRATKHKHIYHSGYLVFAEFISTSEYDLNIFHTAGRILQDLLQVSHLLPLRTNKVHLLGN